MTETAPEAPRIPNVTPGAVSGLDHAPLVGAGIPQAVTPETAPETAPVDSPAIDLGDEPTPLPEVPEDLTTVDDLLGWVNEDESDPESEVDTLSRAVAVLRQEGRDGRVTLVKPLEDLLLDALLDAYAPEDDGADEDQDDGDTPDENGDADGDASGEAVNVSPS